MTIEKVLYGTKEGEPDWTEEIISTNPEVFEAAQEWAKENGFDRFRIAEIDLSELPNFATTVEV